MSRKQETITLSVSQEHKAKLEKKALHLGYIRGDEPTISGLIKAIADDEILLSKPDKPIDEPIVKNDRKMIRGALVSIQSTLSMLLELI
mgnify:CR=1 FL=1